MKKEGFELVLSNDIVQGEDIPFFLLWDDPNFKKISIEYSGFAKINEYYNVKDNLSNKINSFQLSDLKRNFYLGGLLSTQKTNVPFNKGILSVTIEKDDDTKIELFEERTLYTTCLSILPVTNFELENLNKPLLNIKLSGSTTIFIDIKADEDSEIQLTLPIEIQTSMEKFFDSLKNGLDDLFDKYPENPILKILNDLFYKPEEIVSQQQYLDKARLTLEKFEPDEEFQEELGKVFFNAIHVESDILNLIIRPLMEYFESLAANKVFLNSPFLNLGIKEGQNIFKGKIIYQNILEREEIQETPQYSEEPFEIMFNSKTSGNIPLKDLISITRIENDINNI